MQVRQQSTVDRAFSHYAPRIIRILIAFSVHQTSTEDLLFVRVKGKPLVIILPVPPVSHAIDPLQQMDLHTVQTLFTSSKSIVDFSSVAPLSPLMVFLRDERWCCRKRMLVCITSRMSISETPVLERDFSVHF